MPIVMRRCESIQYDGTNGRSIAEDWLANVSLHSDDGQTLVLHGLESEPYTVPRGSWVIRSTPGRALMSIHSQADYQVAWAEIGAQTDPTDPQRVVMTIDGVSGRCTKWSLLGGIGGIL